MSADTSAIILLQSWTNPFFDFLGGIFSLLFVFWLVFGVFVVLYFWKGRKSYFMTTAGLIATGVIVQAIKFVVQRPRPELALYPSYVTYAYSSSFPSGHAALAFLVAVIVSYYHPKYAKILYPVAMLTALFRLYFGVHYLSDVFAGALIGVFAGLFLIYREKSVFRLEAKVNKFMRSFLKV